MCVLSAAEADNGRLSVQDCSPGADERPVKTFHQHLQSGELERARISQLKNNTVALLNMMPLNFPCQVRSKAQNVLYSALGTYNFCCRDLIPHVLKFLNPENSSVTQQQFKVRPNSLTSFSLCVFCSTLGRKALVTVLCVLPAQGALYCLLGNHSGVCLANLHDWECIALTWPAIVRSGLSSAMSLEKPSIVRLFDDLADKIHRQYETIGIDFSVGALTQPAVHPYIKSFPHNVMFLFLLEPCFF